MMFMSKLRFRPSGATGAAAGVLEPGARHGPARVGMPPGTLGPIVACGAPGARAQEVLDSLVVARKLRFLRSAALSDDSEQLREAISAARKDGLPSAELEKANGKLALLIQQRDVQKLQEAVASEDEEQLRRAILEAKQLDVAAPRRNRGFGRRKRGSRGVGRGRKLASFAGVQTKNWPSSTDIGMHLHALACICCTGFNCGS